MTDRHRSSSEPPWRPLPDARRDPTTLRDSLDRLASTLGLGSVDGVNALFLEWPRIVGADVAEHCRPGRLSEGVLTVRATDRQWAVELSWMTELIAERCNEALGEGIVTEVRINH